MNETIRKRLEALCSRIDQAKNGDPILVVGPERLVETVQTLKRDPELRFTTLMNQLGADYGDRLAVLHNLYSTHLNTKITVKTFVGPGRPETPSLAHLFPGCNWFERETYDMFGIVFTGHMNLRRLLLPEDWDGHPLRKDYRAPASYNGIETGRPDLLDEPAAAGGEHV